MYTVTPRDILSFAWQISKGMAYLADIKVNPLIRGDSPFSHLVEIQTNRIASPYCSVGSQRSCSQERAACDREGLQDLGFWPDEGRLRGRCVLEAQQRTRYAHNWKDD